MSAIDKIYNYFDREPDLKVLFIFNDEFLADELREVQWKEGYRFMDFQGDWFTVKYNLDNAWADDRVVLYFHQESPLQKKSLRENFPLLDVLTANMEYKSQDYTAFMQQYGLPDTDKPMMRFVERNIMALQSERMLRLFAPYYQDRSITTDKLVRGFISSYMGVQRILEWDAILLRVILLGRDAEQQKRTDFFVKLRKCKDAVEALGRKLTDIFGTTIDDNTEEKVADVVKVLKYNAIVQNLAPVAADNYKQWRIDNTLALQQMNRLLELALSQEKTADALLEVMDELGDAVRDDELIRWYGTDANYYFVPPRLCQPIVAGLLKDQTDRRPDAEAERTRHNGCGDGLLPDRGAILPESIGARLDHAQHARRIRDALSGGLLRTGPTLPAGHRTVFQGRPFVRTVPRHPAGQAQSRPALQQALQPLESGMDTLHSGNRRHGRSTPVPSAGLL